MGNKTFESVAMAWSGNVDGSVGSARRLIGPGGRTISICSSVFRVPAINVSVIALAA